jgi:hypothetical protein
MRILSIFIICGFIALPSTLRSATLPQPVNTTIYPPEEAYKKLTSLKIKEVQKLIGRKLTFKEKISFLIIKHASKKETKSDKGSTALGFGIAAVATLAIGLFVPYVILIAPIAAILAIVLGDKAKKQDPSNKKAHTAVTLGWVTLGAFALIVIAAVILVSSEGWY